MSSSEQQADGLVAEARALSIAGAVAAAATAVALSAAFVCALGRAGPGRGAAPAPAAAGPWKQRAAAGLRTVAAGVCLQMLAMAAAAASLASPWWAGGLSASSSAVAALAALPGGGAAASLSVYVIASATTLSFRTCAAAAAVYSSCVIVAAPNPVMAPVAGYLYFSLAAASLPALALAVRASLRLRRLVAHDVMPPASQCCALGLPAVLGVAWFAFACHLGAAAGLWGAFALALALVGASAPVAADAAVGSGPYLLALSLVAMLLACTLYSVAGCRATVRGLPGVGASTRTCCLTESGAGAAALPAAAAAKPVEHHPPQVGASALPAGAAAVAVSGSFVAAPLPAHLPQRRPQPQPQPQLQLQLQPKPQPQQPHSLQPQLPQPDAAAAIALARSGAALVGRTAFGVLGGAVAAGRAAVAASTAEGKAQARV